MKQTLHKVIISALVNLLLFFLTVSLGGTGCTELFYLGFLKANSPMPPMWPYLSFKAAHFVSQSTNGF